ncbi:hypothetical protein AAC387_Pa07g2901 [Persea americana]
MKCCLLFVCDEKVRVYKEEGVINCAWGGSDERDDLDGVTVTSSRHPPPIFCDLRFLEREGEHECQDISWGPFVSPPIATCWPHLLDTWAPRFYSNYHDHVANDCVLFTSFVIFTFPTSLNEATT